MKKSTLGILALSATFAGATLAQAPATNPAVTPGSTKMAAPMPFSSMDTNRDGKVSRDEVKSHAELTSSFATLDADRDSYLSESEFGKWKQSGAKDSSKETMPGTSPGTTPAQPMPGTR